MLDLAQYNLFPNATVLLWGEMVNVLIARPGPTPDEAELSTFLLSRHRRRAAAHRRSTFAVPAGGDFGWVLNQDIGSCSTMQRGLHQPGLTQLVAVRRGVPHHQHAPQPDSLPRQQLGDSSGQPEPNQRPVRPSAITSTNSRTHKFVPAEHRLGAITRQSSRRTSCVVDRGEEGRDISIRALMSLTKADG